MRFKNRADSQTDQKFIRGSKKITTQEYESQAKKDDEELDIPFGTVKMPISAEPKHTFIVGRPGVGKTVIPGTISASPSTNSNEQPMNGASMPSIGDS